MNFKNTDISPSKYASIHMWIKRNYGSANHCSNPNCSIKNPKKYEWALIHGKSYTKNINNFIQLCKSCHLLYDKTPEWGKNISKGLKNSNKKWGGGHKGTIPWNKGKTKEMDSRIISFSFSPEIRQKIGQKVKEAFLNNPNPNWGQRGQGK